MSIKIAFITGHYFGLRALEGLISNSQTVLGELAISLLVTLDQSKQQKTVGYCDFAGFTQRHRIPLLVTAKANTPGVITALKASRPDYILVIGWSELVSTEILDIPKNVGGSQFRHAVSHGCIGMHPTLLPEGRGRAPIPWTILKGLKTTGVTAFLLEEAADVGGIILQEEISVEHGETASTLFLKVADCHQRLAATLASMLVNRQLSWHPQDEAKASVWPKRTPEDGFLDLWAPLEIIGRLVRALTRPYPGAFFFYQGKKIIVNTATTVVAHHHESVGTIVSISKDGLPTIATREGFLECREIEPEPGTPPFIPGGHVQGKVV